MDLELKSTIVAQASAPGRAGVAIVRLSGPLSRVIAEEMVKSPLKIRHAHYLSFWGNDESMIDQGIVIYFRGPASFTGEDVVEFHCHGGHIAVDLLIENIVAKGAIIASPGEFSLRAYMNDKIDLIQAEAISDLINASSVQSHRCALNSLQGGFSNRIDHCIEALVSLRVFIEASIDFVDEEIDFLADDSLVERMDQVEAQLIDIQASAEVGVILQEGVKVVILGQPNVGKSSLLNVLADQEIAIVTDVAGTTRDLIHVDVHIEGISFRLVDTAGIRHSDDIIEQEGIKRAKNQMGLADLVLLIVDASMPKMAQDLHLYEEAQALGCPCILIYNKCDLIKEDHVDSLELGQGHCVSAQTGLGIESLKQAILKTIGITQAPEGQFVARRRHLNAIEEARRALALAKQNLVIYRAPEIVAEELNIAQQALGSIKGEFTSDDLLGEIFSSFCIGK